MDIAAPLISLVAGLLFAGVLLALGARVRRLVRVPVAPGLRAGVDFLLGSWMLGTVLLAAGLAGAFQPAVVIAVTISAVVAGRWRRNGRNWSGALGPGLAAVLLLMVALAPPFFFDALTYHLGLPWQALLDGRVGAHPENLFATFPPLAQLVYAPLLAAGLDRVPAVLHLLAFVLAGAAVTTGSRRLGAPAPLAHLAGAILLVLPCHALVPAIAGAEAWL
ncbi:MAG: hypothetical protein GW878_01635, partial [Acidobacteria bacterium]|nr:hypothetical protein [Acidobacteriota bacterium]